MNIYIYDSFVTEKKHLNTIARIETRLTDLGLNGKIIRLGVMNSVFDIIDNEARKGAKTFVAVGNIRLLSLCINALAFLQKNNPAYSDLPLGFIPVAKKNNEIASFLGIDMEEDACDYLSARRIQKIDLGQVDGNKFFFTHAQIPTDQTIVEIDTNFSIEIRKSGMISVVNLPFNINEVPEVNFSGEDNNLELLVEESAGRFASAATAKASVFNFKTLRIRSQKHPLILDGSIETTTPATIELASEKINLIVGKERNF